MILLNSAIELIKSYGMDYNIKNNSLWIYENGKLLRTFNINAKSVNARDFTNWMKYYNEKLHQSTNR